MTLEEYGILNKLVEKGKISRTKKNIKNNETVYTFILKANNQNVSNKYVFKIDNNNKDMIKSLDKLIIKDRVIKRNKNIKNLKIAVGAVAILTTITGVVSIANKTQKYNESVMKEVNYRLEEFKYEHPGVAITPEMREDEYNYVHEERQKNLSEYDTKIDALEKEIEELKKAKQELKESYYETNQNAIIK